MLEVLSGNSMPQIGLMLALAAVCALQYFLYLYHRYCIEQTEKKNRGQMAELEDELEEIGRERSAARIEIQVLREVLTEGNFSRAASTLLRRFVPSPTDGFAVILPLDGRDKANAQTKWLSAESKVDLEIDDVWLERLQKKETVLLVGDDLFRSPFMRRLMPVDRRKASRLYVFGLEHGGGMFAVLATTSLIPVPLPEESRLSLCQRLIGCAAERLHQTLQLAYQNDQLKCTREMLELRAIVDGPYDQPLRMMERFLFRLGQQLETERAALFVYNRDQMSEPRSLLRCGIQLQPNLALRWQQFEDKIASAGQVHSEVKSFGKDRLRDAGVDMLVGTALTIPLYHRERFLGIVCMSRRQSGSFTAAQLDLAGWSAELLAETIQKIFNYVTIERQARQDSLTELANRRAFDSQLSREVESIREGSLIECSLLLLDLDHFKAVNDTYGHQVGDEVLREVARLMKQQVSHVRSSDHPLLARYGGEELAVLMPGVGIGGALRIAESIREAVEQHPFENATGVPLKVTVSIGAASCPLHATTAEELVSAADMALYQAKSSGRNLVSHPEDSPVSR